MAVTLNAAGATLLPNTIAGPIFSKAAEQSAIMRLARKVPMAMGQNVSIPVPMDMPVADWVGEAQAKAVAQTGVGTKQMVGKKVALIVPVSQEVVMSNPGGVLTQLQDDLPSAIARALDYAAINGKSLRTGNAGPFAESLSMATSTVALGTATQGTGGLYADIVNGAGKVIDKNYDFTGIAADPRFKIDALLATDTQGRPLFVDTTSNGTTNTNSGNLAGFPTTFSQGVSGKYWRGGDSVQLVTIVGTPTGGTFVLSSGGNTATIAYNAAAATVQTAVQAWGGVYGTVTVSGSAGGPFTITFPAIAPNVPGAAAPFAVDQRLLTGGTAAASKATIAASGAGGTDSLIRGVGGDWTQAAYGVGMDITVKVDSSASYFDGTNWHSAYQENLTLFLVEAYFGFVVGSLDAFCLYTKGTAPF